MFTHFTQLLSDYYQAAQNNALLAAALLPVTGGIMYLVRGFPLGLWRFFIRNITVSMYLDNTRTHGNDDAYRMFDTWITKIGGSVLVVISFCFGSTNGEKIIT